jgi:hypothetical protein
MAGLSIEVTLYKDRVTAIKGIAKQVAPRFVHNPVLVIGKTETHSQIGFAIKAKHRVNGYMVSWRTEAFLPVNSQVDNSALMFLSRHLFPLGSLISFLMVVRVAPDVSQCDGASTLRNWRSWHHYFPIPPVCSVCQPTPDRDCRSSTGRVGQPFAPALRGLGPAARSAAAEVVGCLSKPDPPSLSR